MRNKLNKTLLVLSIIFITGNVSAQTAVEQYNRAKQQYENGNYTAAIEGLNRVEQQVGANPKTKSLLVYAYQANNDFVNAKIEFTKYKKLVPHGFSDAHKELLQQEKSINEGLTRIEKEHTQKINNDRLRKADAAISSTYNTAQRRQVEAKQTRDRQVIAQKEAEIAREKARIEAERKAREEELAAYRRMKSSDNESIARDFYNDYPRSEYRSEALTLWQQRFINNAAGLQDEPAIERLNGFSSTFRNTYISSGIRSNASNIYNQKWNNAYNSYYRTYKATKRSINKEVIVQASITGLFLGGGYFLGRYLDKQIAGEDEVTPYLTISLPVGGFIGMLGTKPFQYARKWKRQNYKVKEKVDYYSRKPVLP